MRRGGALTGAADSAQEHSERSEWLQKALQQELRGSLAFRMLQTPFTGMGGYAHYHGAYHEWIAACVFYALLEPLVAAGSAHEIAKDALAALPSHGVGNEHGKLAPGIPSKPLNFDCGLNDGGRGALLCHLADSSVSEFNFMDGARFNCIRAGLESRRLRCSERKSGQVIADPEGWVMGADIPNRYGYVTCEDSVTVGTDSTLGHRLNIEAECRDGDLVLGFLKSYDPRMGCVEVAAFPRFTKNQTEIARLSKSTVIDAWHPESHTSVFTSYVLSGLIDDPPGGASAPALGQNFGRRAVRPWSVSLRPIECPANDTRVQGRALSLSLQGSSRQEGPRHGSDQGQGRRGKQRQKRLDRQALKWLHDWPNHNLMAMGQKNEIAIHQQERRALAGPKRAAVNPVDCKRRKFKLMSLACT
mmetsp:Transcript_25576/g.57361  ORF Transcript_25576/g.57361 Transcript_25576/m.57361 type:complete len:416 (+) Transcript_25576:1286-2533(+)